MTLKKWFALVALGAMAVSGPRLSHAEDAKTAAPADAGFVDMFNGKDLTGWDGLEGYWSVKDGVISGSETKEKSAQTFLIYKEPQANFEMHYKYKFATPDGNSGVQFRSKVVDAKKDPHRIGGYQADCDGKGGYDGCIYDEANIAGGRGIMSIRGDKTTWDDTNKRTNETLGETKDAMKKYINVGDWNDVVLIVNGNHVTYTINGHLMTDLTDNSPKAVKDGIIGLQLHKGYTMEIQFKDLKIKKLTGEQK